jgi:glycosyltransferase involved in cell wall biosynthesis
VEEIGALAGHASEPADSTVVFVGRLTYQKDPLFAADVSVRVIASLPSQRFVWVGDGELRHPFVARLDALGVRQNWTLVGWVDNLHPFVAAATVCALASRYESFGYVTLEAMAMEKPMVATKVAGSIDLVESGQNGWLVPVGDVEAFAAALTQVLNDADMRRRMGIAARIRAESFTRERMAKETLAIYTRA